ncbi:hypothetical protein [Paenibacillus sp. NPDC101420]|uniref:hypothetical protein n=1 Tax=Paenibacillus sp. NPDC101420 TaxID=3390602 RepID=UPI003CFF969D
MQTTGNLGLKKPEGTDIVDIADLNGNMDILDNAVTSKVDKVTGKQLSTNDYTGAEKTKLAGIATGANNYLHPNHTGDVTSTGDGVTAIAAGVIVNADVNAAAGIDASKIGSGLVSNAEFGYLDGVTSGIQGQLNSKSNLVTSTQKTTAAITYYIRTDGNDNNAGTANSSNSAFKTIQKAFDVLPKNLDHEVSIFVADGTYAENVIVNGFHGGGGIGIYGNNLTPSNTKINSFTLMKTFLAVSINDLLATTTTSDAFTINRSVGFRLNNCQAIASATSWNGVVLYFSTGVVQGGIYSNKGVGITASAGSQVTVNGVSGTGNLQGVVSQDGAVVLRSNSPLTGTIEATATSGIIHGGVLYPWGDNTTASRSGFSANLSANQSITGSTTTKLLYAAKSWDNLSEYNTTLARFTSKSGGTYLVSASISLQWVPDATRLIMDVFKNGSFHIRLQDTTTGQQNDASIAGTAVMGLSSGDYIEIYVYIGGYNLTAFPNGSHFTVSRCA